MSWDLEVSVNNILFNDDELMNALTGVYESPNETQSYPYAVYGEHKSLPYDTKDNDGKEVIFAIDIWSLTKQECMKILDRIYILLMDNDPILTEWKLRLKKLEKVEVLRDDTGKYHGIFKMLYKLRRM